MPDPQQPMSIGQAEGALFGRAAGGRPRARRSPGAAARQASVCPMDRVLQLLAGPWTTTILWTLQRQGPLRFGALKREIAGISARLLTARLRLLMDAGMVARTACDGIAAERRYGLTTRGLELGAVFSSLDHLVGRWAQEDGLVHGVGASGDSGLLVLVA
ncbi:HTH-type transcriptional activator HxlR [mine drainage metagenome]|uniref:HTH-type transcriptional activator HxlR n=1 Tax=mine drainage metagenome TaxID=410659 RepID=A0A1J5PQ56_9ZZZZ